MIDLLILIFTYLPSFLVHIVLTLGILGLIVTILPISLIIPNKDIIKYLSIFIITLGLFLEGGLAVNNEYLERAKDWNHKVEVAELKAKEANERINYVYVDKIKVVKETQVVIKEKIKKVAVNIDKECKITTDTVTILNDSARKIK
jgi:hypothetical protein